MGACFFPRLGPTPKRAIGFCVGFPRDASAVKHEVRRKWFAQQIWPCMSAIRLFARRSATRQSGQAARVYRGLFSTPLFGGARLPPGGPISVIGEPG